MSRKQVKVVFPDGNIKRIPQESCRCPNKIDFSVNNLVIGENYTIYIGNINSSPVRIFPESYSFKATAATQTMSFYYQYAGIIEQ